MIIVGFSHQDTLGDHIVNHCLFIDPFDSLIADHKQPLCVDGLRSRGVSSRDVKDFRYLSYLLIFQEVARQRSFSRAAETLGMTQPAVSSSVRKLEEYLGVRLLDRLGRHVEPTEMGNTLYRYACEISRLLDEAKEAIREACHLRRGILRIGTTRPLVERFLFSAVADFKQRHPDVVVRLHEGTSTEIVQGVLDRCFDIGVVGQTAYPEDLVVLPLTEIEFFLALSPQRHGFHDREEISLQEIAHSPFVLQERGTSVRGVIEGLFQRLGIRPSVIMEASTINFIKDTVMKGIAVGFLPRYFVEKELKEGALSLLRVKGQRLLIRVDLVYLYGRTLSPAAIAFKELIKERASGLGRSA